MGLLREALQGQAPGPVPEVVPVAARPQHHLEGPVRGVRRPQQPAQVLGVTPGEGRALTPDGLAEQGVDDQVVGHLRIAEGVHPHGRQAQAGQDLDLVGPLGLVQGW